MLSVVVISLNAVGDTYLSLSAIPFLKRNTSEIDITFVVNKKSTFLFKNEEVNVITVEKKILSILRALYSLRKINFDIILSFFPGVANSLLLKLLKGRVKAGYINYHKIVDWHKKANLATIIKQNTKVYKYWEKNYNYLARIEIILSEIYPEENVKLSKYKFNISTIAKDDNIVIHYRSRFIQRSLTIEQLIALVNYLRETFNSPVLIIGSDELKGLEVNDSQIIINPDVRKLVNLVHNKLFIGVDSFPLQIADAFDTNFVGLFSITNPKAVLSNSHKSIEYACQSFSEISTALLIEKLNSYLIKNNNENFWSQHKLY